MKPQYGEDPVIEVRETFVLGNGQEEFEYFLRIRESKSSEARKKIGKFIRENLP